MKKSELKQLIKEEIQSIMNVNYSVFVYKYTFANGTILNPTSSEKDWKEGKIMIKRYLRDTFSPITANAEIYTIPLKGAVGFTFEIDEEGNINNIDDSKTKGLKFKDIGLNKNDVKNKLID